MNNAIIMDNQTAFVMNRPAREKQKQKEGIRILDTPPEGWKRLENANTEPRGYKWYSNGESRFGGHYEHALVKED